MEANQLMRVIESELRELDEKFSDGGSVAWIEAIFRGFKLGENILRIARHGSDLV